MQTATPAIHNLSLERNNLSIYLFTIIYCIKTAWLTEASSFFERQQPLVLFHSGRFVSILY